MIEERDASPAKRKAWAFNAPTVPPLSHLFGSPDERRQFKRYWLHDNIGNGLDLLLHFGLKLLSMDACSRFGAWLGPFAIPRFHKVAVKRGRATLARLLPDKTQAERDVILQKNWQAQGRLMTEFSVVDRIRSHPERFTLHNFDGLRTAARQGPIIIVGMHLGNWEIGTTAFVAQGIHPFAVYVPPKSRAQAWIAERIRLKGGLRFIPPGRQGTRAMVDVLSKGGCLSMFCDEGFQGRIRGPLFGRKPTIEGNLAVAVRLARKTNAVICPYYNIRAGGFRFEFHALEPLRLPPEDHPGSRLIDDIALLNSVIEPVILAHLDQWYFLDNALPDD